ncbi:hypothetical protein QR680_017031 [Steinernema hermaphroditum]|uniref:Uncharacterized protein n=1 Tax=Steinernema hermaphroditum TaxID=289476 RepID=A0AA39HD15_9BILA|nr:hypothetical protein QR680_017031 [Steinernema hermaphroditum]
MPNATVAPYAECFDSIEESYQPHKQTPASLSLPYRNLPDTSRYITAVFSIIACIILGLILAFLAYSYLGKWRRKRRRRKHRINVPPYVVPQAYHRSLTRW